MSGEIWLNPVAGVPLVRDFMTTNTLGAPLVINTLNSTLYYLAAGNVVTLIPTGGGGGSAFTYTTVTRTTGYTETTTTGAIFIQADLAAGFTIVLPTAVGNLAQFTVKKMQAAGQITVATTGGQTIDGGANAILNNQYESITLESNNVGWIIS